MSAITLIQNIKVTSTSTPIAITNIPQTYDDLILKVSTRVFRTGNYESFYIQFNSDTSTAYSYQYLRAVYGSSVGAFSSSATNSPITGMSNYNSATAGCFSSCELYISNYTSSLTKNISTEAIGENNATDMRHWVTGASYTGTSAISSIRIYDPNGGSFLTNSSVSIYGVTSGSSSGITVST